MDRMIYTALNAISVARNEQLNAAQNLANQNVPGYRRDLPNDGAARFLEQMDTLTTRAYQLETGPAGFSDAPGMMTNTGQELDLAVKGEGYLYVEPASGEPALTRRGDLTRGPEGTLRNAAGEAILGPDLAPIQVAEYQQIEITDIGEIFIVPAGAADGLRLPAGVLATVVPEEDVRLLKGEDGHIRAADGTVPEPNQLARVQQGMLEASNVNPVEELLATMEIQRSYERALKLVASAQEIDERGSRLLSAPEA
ncbi:MAG: flagellar hook-basal body complex protein [Rhodobacteraceae bacterium]|nr:flagellar hook-basal body complex protein [Paracoccaceae bacterium]